MKKLGLLLMVSSSAWAAAPKVDVLHWWTSGGEAKALQVLKQDFEKSGGTWTDVPIAGGGGDAAGSVLRSRFVAGNPPGAAMMHMGPQIWEWANEGALADLDSVAKEQGWDKLLPPLVAERVKHKGKYIAVPINVHRLNAMFINAAVMRKHGLKAPTTWDEFNAAADKLQKAGITPLAHGGQPWQDLQLFDAVVLGLGGPEFYKKALIDLDASALGGSTMVRVFDQMRKLKGYTDKGSPGRDWNLATAMVIRGEGAMQIMGDWAKGEFTAAGKKPEKDFLCVASPGSADAFAVNTDAFAFFRSKTNDTQAQALFAKLAMSEKVQRDFNFKKGSIPVRMGMDKKGFDACARDSMDALAKASAKGTATPGFHSANAPAVAGAITDVVTHHFNSQLSSQDAVKRLVSAVQGAK